MIEDLVEHFKNNPSLLEKSSGKLISKGNKIFKNYSYEEINRARNLAKTPEPVTNINLVESTENEGSIVYKFESPKSLSAEELDELVKVDNIRYKRGQTWHKQKSDKTWVYSISVLPINGDFYDKEELRQRLKEIFTKVTPVKLVKPKKHSEKLLTILLSDDHAGAINTTAIFGENDTYSNKLIKLADKILELKDTFEEVYIISLGDQLNGYNSLTTRGGHEVKSRSNKEQFDEYVSARKQFYDTLITSKIGSNYNVIDLENSNHCGLGFSYMANQYLDMYLEMKYPEVNRYSENSTFGGIDYGIHTIVYTHGKDEKFMKKPLPLNIDAKTDLFMFQFLNSRNYNPSSKNSTYTLYKGDLHQFNIQRAKFGRYVNVPSLIGHTDYSDHNFGDTQAGALIEIFEKDNLDITSKLINL